MLEARLKTYFDLDSVAANLLVQRNDPERINYFFHSSLYRSKAAKSLFMERVMKNKFVMDDRLLLESTSSEDHVDELKGKGLWALPNRHSSCWLNAALGLFLNHYDRPVIDFILRINQQKPEDLNDAAQTVYNAIQRRKAGDILRFFGTPYAQALFPPLRDYTFNEEFDAPALVTEMLGSPTFSDHGIRILTRQWCEVCGRWQSSPDLVVPKLTFYPFYERIKEVIAHGMEYEARLYIEEQDGARARGVECETCKRDKRRPKVYCVKYHVEIIPLGKHMVFQVNRALSLDGYVENYKHPGNVGFTANVTGPFYIEHDLRTGKVKIDALEPKKTYYLVSVIAHLGPNFNSGHYVRFDLDMSTEQWFLVDDEYVQHVSDGTDPGVVFDRLRRDYQGVVYLYKMM